MTIRLNFIRGTYEEFDTLYDTINICTHFVTVSFKDHYSKTVTYYKIEDIDNIEFCR